MLQQAHLHHLHLSPPNSIEELEGCLAHIFASILELSIGELARVAYTMVHSFCTSVCACRQLAHDEHVCDIISWEAPRIMTYAS